MQKRKGFTLVELVIVIAVIAILAGVLIGTFASVINRANESAKLQEIKAQEVAQKADDIIKKINESDWFGWEDFEASVVAKLTQVYKATATTGSGLTEEQVKTAVKLAMEEYAKAHASENTSLTEAQVKAIVENALGTLKFEGVTEAQVKAALQTVLDAKAYSTLTAAQVKEVVEAANANNLTAAQVAVVLTDGLKDVLTTENFETKLAAAVQQLSGNVAEVLTAEQLAELIGQLVPVTRKVATVEDFNKAYKELQSGSTIWVETAGLTLDLDLTTGDMAKTLTLRGEAITELNINAPKATVYVMNDVGTLNVEAVANNSLHVFGDVTVELVIKGGRVVFEAGTAKLVTADPDKNASVTVEIDVSAVVTELVAKYQTNEAGSKDWIEVVNNGRVLEAKLEPVSGWTTDANTTNVRITNGTSASGTEVNDDTESGVQAFAGAEFVVVDETTDTATEYKATGEDTFVEVATAESFWGEQFASSFAGGDGSKENPYQISNAYELARLAYLMLNTPDEYKGKNYVLTANIDVTGKTWMPISAYARDGSDQSKWFSGVFDGQGYTITGLSDTSIGKIFHTWFTGTNSTSVGVEYTFGLFGSVKNATVKNVRLENVSIAGTMFDSNTKEPTTVVGANNSTILADSSAALIGYSEGNLTVNNIYVSGSIQASDGVGGVVGRAYNTDKTKTDVVISITNCTNNATVHGYNPARKPTASNNGYSHVAGILGYHSNKNNATSTLVMTGNTNNGAIIDEQVDPTFYINQIVVSKTAVDSSNESNGTTTTKLITE